jgi:hypothetical protein
VKEAIMRSVSCWVLLLAFALPSLARADEPTGLIKNGSFSTPSIGASGFVTRVTAPVGFEWTIVQAPGNPWGVDQIAATWIGIGGPLNESDHDQSVDIDFDNTLSQSFATSSGARYLLTMYYARNPFGGPASSATVTVSGGQVLLQEFVTHDEPGATGSDMKWLLFSREFIADSAQTTLAIQGDVANTTVGFALDDVHVVQIASAPALTRPAVLAMIVGLLATTLLLTSRRRRRGGTT